MVGSILRKMRRLIFKGILEWPKDVEDFELSLLRVVSICLPGTTRLFRMQEMERQLSESAAGSSGFGN